MHDDTAIKFESVRKTYSSTVAADNVDLEIRNNEFFTLLGPSGSGKTTLLRLIGGFEFPTDGRILIHGEDFTDEPPQNRPTNTVFQNYSLFPHMTVAENVGYGLRIDGVPEEERKERIAETLQLLEIDELKNRDVAELSGGQQQRVALARSLILEPEIFLLDEPLGSLDEKLKQNMQVELKNLQETLGITFVYVTHDQEEALTMSDRIAVLRDGDIVDVGASEELYETPATEFTADFLGSGNIVQTGIVDWGESTATVSLFGEEVTTSVGECRETEGPFSVCLRPENLHIRSGEYENSIDGIVRDSIYVGSGYTHHIEVSDDQMFQVFSHEKAGAEEGESVTIGWDSTDSVLVRRNRVA